MPGPNSISAAQLARLIGTPDAPLLIDVRLAEDAASDPFRLPTAVACPVQEVARLAAGRPA
ncbi:MAG: sulfurtransferase, partial [Rhodobacteraceae bacterium]|nr:sulfurtransferase [Paracoccaceae bacterium]